jgi:hypothetical protein
MNELQLRQQQNLDRAGRFLGRFASLLLLVTASIFLGPMIIGLGLLWGVVVGVLKRR